jgi:hypothetical protein
MADPWTVPSKNDAQLRCRERCTDAICRERCTNAIRRTMRGCDMLSELSSIGIDHSMPRYRRSRAFYTRSYLPSQTGQNPPRARLQASARAQNYRKCASGTFLPQGGSVPKVKPRLGVKRHLCMVLPPWPGPGDVELMRMPRHWLSKARLMLPPWHGPGEVQLMLPPWHRPGEVRLMLPPWRRPGEVKLMLPPWHRPGEVELL